MFEKRKTLLCCVVLMLSAGLLWAGSAIGQARRPVLIEGKKSLYLRVLTRPHAKIYRSKSEQSPVVQGNVPAFQLFYVYFAPSSAEASNQKGWYEVGNDDRGTIAGWIKADDLFEWRQTLCLAYSHPEGRKPVLFFEKKEDLLKLASAPSAEREASAESFYSTIDSGGTMPAGFPVISREPSRYIDIEREFYLLPILAHASQRFDNREGRLLKVASVVATGEDVRESSDIRRNASYRDEASRGIGNIDPEMLRNLTMDIVWVLDTTLSTQPYINKTLEAVKDASDRLALSDALAGEKMRFGVWGFRDSIRHTPGLEYVTKNFTPSLLPIAQFHDTLRGVKAADVDSGVEWDQDVFTGMSDAISKTNWRPKSARFVILAGDAPGHEAGHPKNYSRFNAERVRALANERNVSVFSLYIVDPRAKKEQEKGERQFGEMSTNPGTTSPATLSVPSQSEDFLNQTMQITKRLISTISQSAQGQKVTALVTPSEDVIDQTIRAALVEWIGSETHTRAPRDVVGWVADKDLTQPAIQALDIKLLISKRQLSALTEALRSIVQNMEEAKAQSRDFFDQLQAAVATQARDPGRLSTIQNLAQSGAVPEFLQGLPYTSRVMDLTRDSWQNMSADDQSAFLNDLRGKIAYYEHVHATPELWIRISAGDDPDDTIHPLDFSQLP